MLKSAKCAFKILAVICYIAMSVYLFACAPMLLGYKSAVVVSGSMQPTYTVGSVIYYKAEKFENIDVGDPIVFKISNTLVTHRVAEKNAEDRTFITRGDANPSPDTTPVQYSSVQGVAIKYNLPYLGHYVTFMQSSFLLPGSIAVILIIHIILNSMFENNKQENKESEENVDRENSADDKK